MVSQKAIILEYKVCVGLYAYLRQVEMSLDRALPSDIYGIREYFLKPGVYKIDYVADFFEALLLPKKSIVFKKNASHNILGNILWNNSFEVSWDKIMVLTVCLRRVYELINQEKINAENFINMRMLLSKIGWDILGKKISSKYVAKAYLVEFYNHTKNSSFFSIDDILEDRWLD